MENTTEELKNGGKKQVRKNENPAPLFVSVKTASGNIVTMRRIPDEEIKALRNPAYQYLA